MRHRLKFFVLGLVASTAAALVVPAYAHHSFAMFDQNKVVTLRGTIKEFRWVNPHVSLFVEVTEGPAKHGVWAVELTSPGNLTRLGWSRKSLNTGDKVEVEVNPLRDGQPAGGFRKAVVLGTGQVLQARLVEIDKAS
jgi:hypothetical protein